MPGVVIGAEQFEQRLERRQVPFLGLLQVFEANQFIHAGCGKLLQSGGVEFLARNGEHDVAGVDQRRQQDDHPFRFQARAALGSCTQARGRPE